MVKKLLKTAKKKLVKTPAKKTIKKTIKKIAEKNCHCGGVLPTTKPIGEITHYFGNIGVAIIKFKQETKIGEMIKIKGARSDFEQKIESMQYEHQPIEIAKKNQEVGVKVKEKVYEGDKIYLA